MAAAAVASATATVVVVVVAIAAAAAAVGAEGTNSEQTRTVGDGCGDGCSRRPAVAGAWERCCCCSLVRTCLIGDYGPGCCCGLSVNDSDVGVTICLGNGCDFCHGHHDPNHLHGDPVISIWTVTLIDVGSDRLPLHLLLLRHHYHFANDFVLLLIRNIQTYIHKSSRDYFIINTGGYGVLLIHCETEMMSHFKKETHIE